MRTVNKKHKLLIRGERIVIRAYPVIEQAVDDGVRYGLLRRCVEKGGYITILRKDEESAVEEIVNAVMNSICEAVRFELDGGGE
jgi:hypothetical protein